MTVPCLAESVLPGTGTGSAARRTRTDAVAGLKLAPIPRRTVPAAAPRTRTYAHGALQVTRNDWRARSDGELGLTGHPARSVPAARAGALALTPSLVPDAHDTASGPVIRTASVASHGATAGRRGRGTQARTGVPALRGSGPAALGLTRTRVVLARWTRDPD